jgi:diguanylate cyclase (GGDEF)-like protein
MQRWYSTVVTVCGLYFLGSCTVITTVIETQRALLRPGITVGPGIVTTLTRLDEAAVVLLVAGFFAVAALHAFVWTPLDRAVHRERAALERAAATDALTGLLNRSAFSDRAIAALAASARHHRRGAMLMIDIDRFKQVNDTFGHAAGDQVQREIGARLNACVRADEFAGRIGGDEYAVFAPDVDAGLEAFVARIRAAVRFTLDIDGTPVTIATSIGVARFPADGFTIEALLGSADRALYEVKNTRRGGVRFASRPAVIA